MKDHHSDLQPWIEPELEVRIVAWTLGEASEFEAAELERIACERPEVRAFLQEIKAAHDLASAAMGAEQNRLQMAPERRAKLLEALGAISEEIPEKVAVLPQAKRKVPLGVRIIELAAVAVILLILAAISLPVFSSVQYRASRSHVTFGAFENAGSLGERDKQYAIETNQLSGNPVPLEELRKYVKDGTAPAQAAAPGPVSAPAKMATQTAASQALADISKNLADETEKGKGTPNETRGNVSRVAERAFAKRITMPQSGALFASNGLAVAGDIGAPSALSPSFDTSDAAPAAMPGGAPLPPGSQAQTALKPQASALPDPSKLALAGGNTYSGSTSVAGGHLTIDGFISGGGTSSAKATTSPAEVPERETTANFAKLEPTRGGRPEPAILASKDAAFDGVENRDAEDASAGKPKIPSLQPEASDQYLGMLTEEKPSAAEQAKEVRKQKGNSESTKYAIEGENNTRAVMSYQVENAWNRPVAKFGTPPGVIVGANEKSDTREAQRLQEKLNQIVIPKIEFKNSTVREALDFLHAKSKELDNTESDPNRRGVNIVQKMDTPSPPDSATPSAAKPDGNLGDATITLSLKDIPLGEALNYVTKLANLKYKLDPNAAIVTPISEATETLVTKEYEVPPEFFPKDASGRVQARKFLEDSGVQFPPGAYANYLPTSGRLVVKTTQENLDLVDTLTEIAADKPPTKKQLVEEVTQGETAVKDQPFSTFSLHVSDVSFRLAQAALAKGQMPDPESIRPEEFYNAFDYGDPAPSAGEKVGCHVEQCAHPVLQQRNLVRIAMRVPASGRGKGQPLRLTLLLDTSGSMEREDRAGSVRRAMEVLASLLGPEDRLTLIGFARQPRLLLEEIPGNEGAKLVEAVTHTPSQGGTNLEEALRLAGELALKHRAAGAQNRIVMITDGAVNLGNAQPESLAKMVEKLRQQGVSFDACGVGAEGYNDEVLEALTRKGDGRYYFLNHPEDADAGFAQQLAGALRPAAQNVKVQVNFNPARVAHYRLIGFEQHRLKKEDFRNDKVTAAELAAEEAAVALYQVEVLPEGEGELGEVSVRFREAASTEMVERCWTLPFDAQAKPFDKAAPSMQLAGTAALVAEKIRGGAMGNLIELDALTPVVNGLRSRYGSQANVQTLVNMFGQLQRMK